LIAVFVGASVYGLALLRFGAITRAELIFIPKVKKLVPLLDRIKILKP
jgi:hypothetical protein